LKQITGKFTAKSDVAVGLKQEITKRFLGELKRKGLNLDGNPTRKKH